MDKKIYQKPSFISKSGTTVTAIPAVLAAAAGSVAAAVASQAVMSMFEEDCQDGSLVAIRPVKMVTV